MNEEVVLVDASDTIIGRCDKLEAHRGAGRLHRAFSVMLVDDDRRMLLQRRALSKYHFGGRWSNSCCGHPRPGETTIDAARRRVGEELGVAATIEWSASFEYTAHDLSSGLVEREIDHVFWGAASTDLLQPDRAEVEECRWITGDDLDRWMRQRPDEFTPWFASVIEMLPICTRTPIRAEPPSFA